MATVLVIDDEFGVAELIEMALEDDGHRVVSAVNGRQGLERLAELAPDLVLLDYMMPILDGPGVLRAMRADPALRAIPVVLMTSLDEETARRGCEGYAAFLRKPFRIDALLRTVSGLLARARPGGAAEGS